jgi:hypothetical protein
MSGHIADSMRLLRPSPASRIAVEERAHAGLRVDRAAAKPSIANQAMQRALTTGLLQAKLAVNEPGDQYEQEADRVADRVMRLASPGGTVPATPAGQGLQRACASCEEEERLQRAPLPDVLQRKCAACEEEEEPLMRAASGILQRDEAGGPAADPALEAEEIAEEEEEKDGCAQTKRAPGVPVVTPSIEAGIDSLRGRGTPLSPPTRDFFEQRLGYDFGSVRVHTGPRADASARSVGALAYTLGTDVVFGAGQYAPHSDTGRRLLAHELTHVVQQTPAAARKIARTAAPVREHGAGPLAPMVADPASSGVIQRQAYYWAPNRAVGTAEHGQILTALGGKNKGLFTEAPVGATRKHEHGQGAVDLYRASTTIGVYFHGHNDPKNLENLAAPFYDGLSVKRVDKAPKDIRIGELKPPPDSEEALKGRDQLTNYLGAIRDTVGRVSELACSQPAMVDPPCKPVGVSPTTQCVNQPEHVKDDCWHPETGYLEKLVVPPQYSETGSSTPVDVVLKTAHRVWAVVNGRGRWVGAHQPIFEQGGGLPARARLIVGETAPNKNGIFSYAYVPENAFYTVAVRPGVNEIEAGVTGLETRLRADVSARRPTVARKIDPQLPDSRREPPAVARAAASPVIQRRRRAGVQSPKVEGHDPFKEQYADWKATRKTLKQKYKAALKVKGGVADDQTAARMMEAYQDAKADLGLKTDRFKPSMPVQEASKRSRKMRFWLGVPGAWAGAARYYFGKGVVSLVNLFESMKAGVRRLLTPARPSGGLGGAAAAAGKALIRVAKLAAAYLIERTFDALVTSLMEGVKNKVKTILEETDNLEAFKAKFKAIRDIQCRLEQQFAEWFTAIKERFETYLNVFNHLEEAVKDITTIINVVKWGIRIAACLSPPGIGCLWLLVQAATEYVLQKMIESCWFQDEVMPVVLALGEKVKAIREAPGNLANWIIEGINSRLPDPLKGIFATVPSVASNPGPSDLPCDDEMDRTDWARKAAIEQLIKEMGAERYDALVALMQKWGVKSSEPPTPAQLDALIKEMRSHRNVSAEDMREFARLFPEGPDKWPEKMVSIGQFMNGIKAALDPETGHVAMSGAGGDGANGGATAGAGGGSGAGGREAKPTMSEADKAKLKPTTFYPTVTGLGAGVYAGSIVRVTFAMKVRNRAYSFPNVEYKVLGRTFRPDEKRPKWIDFKVKLAKDAFFTVTDDKDKPIDHIAFYVGKDTPTITVDYSTGIGRFPEHKSAVKGK